MNAVTTLLTAFLLLTLLVGCATSKRETQRREKDAQIQRQVDKHLEERQTYLGANSNLPPNIVTAINNGQILRGMTETQVKLAWRSPEKVNRSVSGVGRRDQWIYNSQHTGFSEKLAFMRAGIGVYSGRRYLYFRNGILDSWQEIN